MPELIVAMDVANAREARSLAGALRGHVDWLKVGLELFAAEGPEIVRALREMGFRIFLDLKFYDIPNTVKKAVAAALAMNVDMLTLHCQGGERMCREALAAAKSARKECLLFGVTALTSFEAGEMPGIGMSPSEFGLFLAKRAHAWGLPGVVCSGHEASAIKKACPGLLCLCPGIRPPDAAMEDQRRVMTPRMAVEAGADFLVAGRPVRQAPDPAAAADAIKNAMALA